MRVTPLTALGVPVFAQNIKTAAFFEFAADPIYGNSDEIVIQSACGGVAAATKSVASLLRLDLALTLTNPDPDVIAALTSGSSITSGGLSVGYVYPAQTGSPGYGAVLEVWTKAVTLDHSAATPPGPYWRFTFPKTIFTLIPGAIKDDLLDVHLDGFCTENVNAGTGPNGDWPAAAATGKPAYFRDLALP